MCEVDDKPKIEAFREKNDEGISDCKNTHTAWADCYGNVCSSTSVLTKLICFDESWFSVWSPKYAFLGPFHHSRIPRTSFRCACSCAKVSTTLTFFAVYSPLTRDMRTISMHTPKLNHYVTIHLSFTHTCSYSNSYCRVSLHSRRVWHPNRSRAGGDREHPMLFRRWNVRGVLHGRFPRHWRRECKLYACWNGELFVKIKLLFFGIFVLGRPRGASTNSITRCDRFRLKPTPFTPLHISLATRILSLITPHTHTSDARESQPTFAAETNVRTTVCLLTTICGGTRNWRTPPVLRSCSVELFDFDFFPKINQKPFAWFFDDFFVVHLNY